MSRCQHGHDCPTARACPKDGLCTLCRCQGYDQMCTNEEHVAKVEEDEEEKPKRRSRKAKSEDQ